MKENAKTWEWEQAILDDLNNVAIVPRKPRPNMDLGDYGRIGPVHGPGPRELPNAMIEAPEAEKAFAYPAIPIESALDRQIDGNHYQNFAIQPGEFCQKNNLRAYESNIVKYACRHNFKGKAKDVLKLIHYAEMLLEFDYPEEYKAYKETKQ